MVVGDRQEPDVPAGVRIPTETHAANPLKPIRASAPERPEPYPPRPWHRPAVLLETLSAPSSQSGSLCVPSPTRTGGSCAGYARRAERGSAADHIRRLPPEAHLLLDFKQALLSFHVWIPSRHVRQLPVRIPLLRRACPSVNSTFFFKTNHKPWGYSEELSENAQMLENGDREQQVGHFSNLSSGAQPGETVLQDLPAETERGSGEALWRFGTIGCLFATRKETKKRAGRRKEE